jgi:hypothetical protein
VRTIYLDSNIHHYFVRGFPPVASPTAVPLSTAPGYFVPVGQETCRIRVPEIPIEYRW